MVINPGPSRGHDHFVGREAEVATLDAAATDPSVRVICLHGARGAGKTTLASRLFFHHHDAATAFDRTIYITAHGKSSDLLLDDLYRGISATPQRAYTPAELPGLLEYEVEAQRSNILIFVDNVEADVLAGQLFSECVRMLTTTRNRCLLLLTSRNPLPPVMNENEYTVRRLEVVGIREPAAVLSLLGDALRFRHSAQDLMELADTIGRLPQRLLYCRWAQPTDVHAFTLRFSEQQQPLSLEALRRILDRLSDPLPLLACGVLRGTDIDTNLLRSLTKRLGRGGQTSFHELLEEMLGHRLIAPVVGTTNAIRIHPDTHVDLIRLCEERGRPWARDCHRAAWDYYAMRCEAKPQNVTAVAELVHHGIALGRFGDAYQKVFLDGRVEQWRQQGLSIQVEPILQELRNAGTTNGILASQEQRANICVALAHISSDLGRPNLCLEYLTEALQHLDGASRTDAVNRTFRRLWMQKAISHANLGDAARCIEYYRRVIESDDLVLEPQTALCMGYLGYEYCDFEDFNSANHWTQRALDHCSFERNPQVYSKNLSNRGLVLYFEGRVAAAAAHMSKAIDLVGSTNSPAYDIREHGRALSHYAMVRLAQQHSPVSVNKLLEQSLSLTIEAGDARRTALTEGRMGIVAGKNAEFERAESLLRKAIVSHSSVGDVRNMIFEILALLTIWYLKSYGQFAQTLGDLERSATIHSDDGLAGAIASSISSPDKRYLVDFWLHRQHPRIFAT